MNFFDYKPTFFDPSKPNQFDYTGEEKSLAERQAMARQLMDIPMGQGTVRSGRGTAIAAILAKALGGYMQGQGIEARRGLDASDKDAASWLQGQINDPAAAQQQLELVARDQANTTNPINENIYTHKNPEQVGPQLAQAFGVRDPQMTSRSLDDPNIPPAPPAPSERSMSDIFNINEDALDRSQMANQSAYESALSRAVRNRDGQLQDVLRSGGPRVSALARSVEAQRAAAIEDKRFKERKAWEWQNQPHTVGKDQSLFVGGQRVATGVTGESEWKPNSVPFTDPQGNLVQQFTNEAGQVKLVPLQADGKPAQTQKTVQEAEQKRMADNISMKDSKVTSALIDDVLASDVPEQASTPGVSAVGRLTSGAVPNRWNDAHMKLETIKARAADIVMSKIQQSGVSPTQMLNSEKELALRIASSFKYEPGMSAESIRAELQRLQAGADDIIKQARYRLGGTGNAPAVPGYGQRAPASLDALFPPKR